MLKLSPIATEALGLLAGSSLVSVNSFGLSQLATRGTPAYEWSRAFQFVVALEQLGRLGLVTKTLQPKGSKPEYQHWLLDHDRIRAHWAEVSAVRPSVVNSLLLAPVGPRSRPSALAEREWLASLAF